MIQRSGIRTEKTVNGIITTYHLVEEKVTFEKSDTDEIYYTYDSNDQLVGLKLSGVQYYYVRNGQSDIIVIVNGSGTPVFSYSYDSWGKLISITGSLASTVGEKNPYRYRGYRYDTETGMYYLQSRYYNPEWSRFINADVIMGEEGELLSHNVFAYCQNNPVIHKDDSGYWLDTALDVASLVYNVAKFVKNPTKANAKAIGIDVICMLIPGVTAVGVVALMKLGTVAKIANKLKGLSKSKVLKVIGHYPEYITMSNKLGVKPFSIPDKIWNKMTSSQQWAANKKFLDRAIKKSSEFILATPLNKVRPGSYLEKEIKYLISQGYKLSRNGRKLIK